MKIEFDDHDEYDDLVKDLARMISEDLDNGGRDIATVMAALLRKLLEGEIVEP